MDRQLHFIWNLELWSSVNVFLPSRIERLKGYQLGTAVQYSRLAPFPAGTQEKGRDPARCLLLLFRYYIKQGRDSWSSSRGCRATGYILNYDTLMTLASRTVSNRYQS